MTQNLSEAVYKRILRFQQDEITDSLLYEHIAKRQKNEDNKNALLEISKAEQSHYAIWKKYTNKEIGPKRFKLALFKVVSRILGYTFTIKFMEKGENFGAEELRRIEQEIPEARAIADQEEEHEKRLMDMMDEERLHYVGSMVLGLNDALVELTGTIAGLTFALANTRLVALSAIITGISATLSMAASNYLAEHANGNSKALKSSAYTGVAYLVAVAIMVTPYLLLPNELYVVALAVMLAAVVIIILLFTYYLSVAQDLPFFKRFGEMALISLGVAAISFGIGLVAKALLGIDVG